MAWTLPRTWVTGENVTSAIMNAHVRDNFLETSAATVTTAGDIAYADAANSMGSRVGIGPARAFLGSDGSAPVWRSIATDVDAGSGSDNNTIWSSLGEGTTWAFASAIEVTLTTGTAALVLFKSRLSNSNAGAFTYLSYSISGATTNPAADGKSIWFESSAANDQAHFAGFDYAVGLTAGSNTFTLAGRVNAGLGTISRPEIAVIPF